LNFQLRDDDDDVIVSGTEDFAATVQSFGYDEDDLEEDWDENIDLAEAQVTQAQGRLDAMEVDLDAMTEEELEAWENSATPTLRSVKESFSGQDIDDIIASKGDVQALKDDGAELSASDAAIRERLFELTGEEGRLAGRKGPGRCGLDRQRTGRQRDRGSNRGLLLRGRRCFADILCTHGSRRRRVDAKACQAEAPSLSDPPKACGR
jgi:hypothetical protein